MRDLKSKFLYIRNINCRRTLYECVYWNVLKAGKVGRGCGHILYGCVGWNVGKGSVGEMANGRTHYGCEDWNENQVVRLGENHIVASYMDAWIEINVFLNLLLARNSRIPYGCEDWNDTNTFIGAYQKIPHLPRCVDWNKFASEYWPVIIVASYIDAWIEIWMKKANAIRHKSHPKWIRGLKLQRILPITQHIPFPSSKDAWIEISRTMRMLIHLTSRILHGCKDWNSKKRMTTYLSSRSHPPWVRGLKYG